MRCLIAGGSGFLGSNLIPRLRADGYDVIRLTREPTGEPDAVHWTPYDAPLDPSVLDGVDVVINLAGASTVGNPHSKRWAEELEHSRVTTTRVLAEAIAASPHKPAFLAGNGISIYGDHGDQIVDESSDSRGDSLLTRVTRVWQEAATPASDAGARVVILRTAPVIDRLGMPLKTQLPQFRLGLGGKFGSGEQFYPVMTLRDWIAAALFCAANDEVSGPVNMCIPDPGTNAEFTDELAALVRRPAFLTAPAFALKAAAGPMAPELLGSIRAIPKVLLDAGFEFADPTMRDVVHTGVAALRG